MARQMRATRSGETGISRPTKGLFALVQTIFSASTRKAPLSPSYARKAEE